MLAAAFLKNYSDKSSKNAEFSVKILNFLKFCDIKLSELY